MDVASVDGANDRPSRVGVREREQVRFDLGAKRIYLLGLHEAARFAAGEIEADAAVDRIVGLGEIALPRTRLRRPEFGLKQLADTAAEPGGQAQGVRHSTKRRDERRCRPLDRGGGTR